MSIVSGGMYPLEQVLVIAAPVKRLVAFISLPLKYWDAVTDGFSYGLRRRD